VSAAAQPETHWHCGFRSYHSVDLSMTGQSRAVIRSNKATFLFPLKAVTKTNQPNSVPLSLVLTKRIDEEGATASAELIVFVEIRLMRYNYSLRKYLSIFLYARSLPQTGIPKAPKAYPTLAYAPSLKIVLRVDNCG